MVNVGAGILAGGKSSRMGENKALLRCGDKNFLELMADKFAGFPETVVSVGSMRGFETMPYKFVCDELEDFGPVEGIYQMLRACESPYMLVAATDMQYLTSEFLSGFAAMERGDEDCLVLRCGGLIEPLCSIYGRAAAPVLSDMLRRGEHRIRKMYDGLSVRYVDAEELGADVNMFRNINTHEDYETLLRERRERK